ncbi:unnamed protein product [Chrysoparadoxa australica]
MGDQPVSSLSLVERQSQRSPSPIPQLLRSREITEGGEDEAEVLPLNSQMAKRLMSVMPEEQRQQSFNVITRPLRGRERKAASKPDAETTPTSRCYDIIGAADSVKQLLQLPYCDSPLSIGLHRVGETLLLDSPLEGITDGTVPVVPVPPGHGTNHSEGVKALADLQALVPLQSADKGSPAQDRSFMRPQAFWRHVSWQLQGLDMLLGSNLVVCKDGDSDRSASVHIHDDTDELTTVTCLDYYLANIMENVPELALCMRSKGYIQGCRLVPTEDIPYLGCDETGTGVQLFDPKDVELNATTLLRFLQENCQKDGGTYLLHREANGQSLELYDVTALTSARLRRWQWLLAMLCYRFAVRLGQHIAQYKFPDPEQAPTREQLQGRQRQLLQNCMELLEELRQVPDQRHKHETISAAVQGQLAASHIASAELDTAQDYLIRGVSILRGALAEATLAHQGREKEEVVYSDNEPVAVMSCETGCSLKDGCRYYKDKSPRALRSGDVEAEEEVETGRDEGELGGSSKRDAEGNAQGASAQEEADQEEEDPLLAMSLVSEQMIDMQSKLVETCINAGRQHFSEYLKQPDSEDPGPLCRAGKSFKDAAGHLLEAFTMLHTTRSYPKEHFDIEERAGIETSEENSLRELESMEVTLLELAADNGHMAATHGLTMASEAGEGALAALRAARRLRRDAPEPPLGHVQEPPGDSRDVGELRDLCQPVHGQINTQVLAMMKRTRTRKRALREEPQGCVRDTPCLAEAPEGACFALSQAVLGCYEAALRSHSQCRDEGNSDGRQQLEKKAGAAYNVLAQQLTDRVRVFLASQSSLDKQQRKDSASLHATMLATAESCLWQGVGHFEAAGDGLNTALLLCNLASGSKLKPRLTKAMGIPDTGSSQEKIEQGHYEAALELCGRSHASLGVSENSPAMWARVSEETAVTYLTLGVLRRGKCLPAQGNRSPPTSKEESDILNLLRKALDIYSDMGNPLQSAACRYQIGLFYHLAFRCLRTEHSLPALRLAKAPEYAQGALAHLGAAEAYFTSHAVNQGATAVVVLLELAELLNWLGSEVIILLLSPVSAAP